LAWKEGLTTGASGGRYAVRGSSSSSGTTTPALAQNAGLLAGASGGWKTVRGLSSSSSSSIVAALSHARPESREELLPLDAALVMP
jgi:hypothetical protein